MPKGKYQVTDQNGIYFLTISVVDWIDILTRVQNKDLIVESLSFCIEKKGLEIFAWVLMSNHLHFLARVNTPHEMSVFLRDFKKFTSRKMIDIMPIIGESRREWLKKAFREHGENDARIKFHKIWTEKNHAVLISPHDHKAMNRIINYIHLNPVKQKIVQEAWHYIHSSAINYQGGKGLLPVTLI